MNSVLPSFSAPVSIHPALWRASQLAQGRQHVVSTGFPALNRELPGGGWPYSTFIEVLPHETGTHEIQLLRPALQHATRTSGRRIILLNCPAIPNALCWLNWQLGTNQLIWVQPNQAHQVLWAAEQILRHDACAALLLWSPANLSLAAMRKLHLAAQRSTTLFFCLRSPNLQTQPSPAPLRLCLKAAPGGVHIHILKRQGPTHTTPLYLPLNKGFSLQPGPHAQIRVSHHVLDQPIYTS